MLSLLSGLPGRISGTLVPTSLSLKEYTTCLRRSLGLLFVEVKARRGDEEGGGN